MDDWKKHRRSEGCPKAKVWKHGKFWKDWSQTNNIGKSQIGQDQVFEEEASNDNVGMMPYPLKMFYRNLPEFCEEVKLGNEDQYGNKVVS